MYLDGLSTMDVIYRNQAMHPAIAVRMRIIISRKNNILTAWFNFGGGDDIITRKIVSFWQGC